MKQRTRLLTSLAMCLLLISACGNTEKTIIKSDVSSESTLQVSDSGPQPDYNGRMPDEFLYQKPEWPREIRKETFGDAEIFSTPRIQFIAELYGDKLFAKQTDKSLWSMRPDGSDRRLVATREEITYEGGGLTHTPIRSPNNRYVALSLSDKEYTYYRGILDLKTREKWIIHQGGGRPHFNWTSDSENLIFYSDGKHYNYHLPSKNLTERPIIYSSGLFLLPGDKEFLAFKSNGFWIHTFEGEVIKKVEFDFPMSAGYQHAIVSPGGKLFYFTSYGNLSNIVDVKTGELLKQMNTESLLGTSHLPLFLNNQELYIYLYDKYRIVNARTGTKKNREMDEVFIWSMAGFEGLSIFNNQPSN